MGLRILLCLALLLIISCGQNPPLTGKRKMVGISMLNEGVITDMNTAQDICYAFKSKNIHFRTNLVGEEFVFKLSTKNCEGESSTDNIQTVLTQAGSLSPMTYTLDDDNHLDIVQTHKHGLLRSLCANIFLGNQVSNTKSSDGSREKMQYIFYDKNITDFDGVSLIYFRDNESSSYKEIRLYMDLENSFDGKYGLVYRFELFEECEIGPFQKSFIREYVP